MLVVAAAKPTSRIKTIRAVEMSRSNGNSLDTVSFLTRMGLMIAAIPISSKTLMILLPITLPTRMSVLPDKSDEKETASSGAPVPKATMVRPIRSLETLKLDATDEEPETNQSAPLIRKIKPKISSNICNIIVIILMF